MLLRKIYRETKLNLPVFCRAENKLIDQLLSESTFVLVGLSFTLKTQQSLVILHLCMSKPRNYSNVIVYLKPC